MVNYEKDVSYQGEDSEALSGTILLLGRSLADCAWILHYKWNQRLGLVSSIRGSAQIEPAMGLVSSMRWFAFSAVNLNRQAPIANFEHPMLGWQLG